MKERIKEIVDSNGKVTFHPQFRFVFQWVTCGSEYHNAIFDNIQDCRDYLNYRNNVKEVVHKV